MHFPEARASYPFAAIVGQDAARLALMLLAIEPRLGGVLIGAGSGSAKTSLARGFRSIIQAQSEDNLPFVEVPLNVSEDRLLGSIDIERTIATGKKRLADGLLAQADSGALFVDHASLLDERIANHIAAALDSGEVRIEREGLSAVRRSKFMLVGTFNPDEGEVSPRLRDRAGLIVESVSIDSPDSRVEIMSRSSAFHESPGIFCPHFEEENEAIARAVAGARERLPRVVISTESIRKLSLAALSLGIEGNRFDLLAVRAARASAALAARDEVGEPDLITAIQMALAPRAERFPEPEEQEGREDFEPDEKPEAPNERLDDAADSASDLSRQADELVIQAVDLPVAGLNITLAKLKRPSPVSGRRALSEGTRRGRHIKSAELKQPSLKIAVAATLRAAAPFQKRRGAREGNSGARRPSVKIERSDLRFKQFKQRSGMLFVFAIDGSGSMVSNRMAQAKGAMIRLLQEAYLHRDKVALISFRGQSAEVLMPPTRSVEIAKRLIDALPSGGGTPLASGLIRSLNLARLARLRKMARTMVVVFTDGRANVAVEQGPGSIAEELRQVGAAFQAEGVASVVIDTRSKFISGGEARELARKLGGRYLYLPRADSTSIYKAVTSIASGLRIEPSV